MLETEQSFEFDGREVNIPISFKSIILLMELSIRSGLILYVKYVAKYLSFQR